jgi:hypothetical protein
MWKDLLDKSKCLLGFHEGPWQYRRANSCTQVQKCERCGRDTERVEHRWGEWVFEAERRCDLVRACARCAQTEKSLTHSWGEPTYQRADACDRVAICARCDEEQNHEPLHVFDGWSYQADDDCAQVEACSRCGQAGSATRLQHDWNEWTRSEFYASQVRVCRHCGEMLLDASGSGGREAISMQTIEADVDRLVAAQTAQQIRSTLTGSASALLTPAADRYFQFAFDQYPHDDDSTDALAAARTLVTRCREVGVDAALQECGIESPPAPTPPPPRAQAAGPAAARHTAPAASSLDKRLFGHWRSTEILGAGTGFSRTIDTHCVLDGSGRFEFWTKSASGSGDVESGTWAASGSQLTLSFEGEGSLSREYALRGSEMVWPSDGRWPFWERVG